MSDLQRTEAWLAARAGKVTASNLWKVVTRLKSGKYCAERETHKGELVCERLTGTTTERFVSYAMRWGTEHEEEHRRALVVYGGRPISPAGFVDHPSIPMAGASPDGFIDEDGLWEGKCPNTTTHIATLLGEPPNDKYIYQMQWQMACTGKQWALFTSYDPRLPGSMQLSTPIRVDRDDALIAEMEREVKAFNAEINVIVNELRERYEEAA